MSELRWVALDHWNWEPIDLLIQTRTIYVLIPDDTPYCNTIDGCVHVQKMKGCSDTWSASWATLSPAKRMLISVIPYFWSNMPGLLTLMIDIREMSKESGNGVTTGNHNLLSLYERGDRKQRSKTKLTVSTRINDWKSSSRFYNKFSHTSWYGNKTT